MTEPLPRFWIANRHLLPLGGASGGEAVTLVMRAVDVEGYILELKEHLGYLERQRAILREMIQSLKYTMDAPL